MLAMLALCSTARADAPPDTEPAITWHAGLELRTDLGTHPVRVPIGLRRASWDATVVLDPYAFLDGEHDLDAVAEWYVDPRIGLLAGWRWTAISVAGGLLHQQRSVIGITGVGPKFGPVHTSATLELATLWVKHGAGTMTEWISADRNLIDHFAFGLSVRFDYAR